MGIIGSAAISFGVNILTNISVSISSFASNKMKQKKLFNLISDYNSKYENTVIDTKTFASIIESEEFSEDIYNYIFRNTSKTVSTDHFIAQKTNEIVDNFNQKNSIYGRPTFEGNEVVISYLTELIDKLTEFKNKDFNPDELALLSSINTLITENREIIVQEVKEQFKLNQMDNEFAENVIDNLVTSNSNFEFEVADNIYNQLIKNKEQISNSQLLRISVEYSKTCAYRDQFKKISDIIEQINSLPNSEKYIYEINYIKSIRLRELDSSNECIEYFESQNYSKEVIALRRCEVQSSIGNFEQIQQEILDQDNNLQINFGEFPEAHYYRGLYLCIQKEFLDVTDFATALSLKKSTLYEFYNLLITIRKQIHTNQFENLKDIYKDFFEFENYLNYFTKQEQLNYWSNYFQLNSIFRINKLNYIENKLVENDFYNIPILKLALAEALAVQGNNLKALEIVDSVLPKTNESQILLFNFLFELEFWDRIITEYEKLESLTEQADIRLIYLFAHFKIEGIENKLEEIVEYCKKQNSLSCYYKAIIFFTKYSSEHFISLLNIIEVNISIFNIEDQSFLIHLIYQNNYPNEVQRIILSLSELNDSLISMLLSTMPLSEESIEEIQNYKPTIDDLAKKYNNVELIVYSIELDLALKIITSDTFNNINKLNNFNVDPSMIAYFNLSAKYLIEDFSDIDREIQILSKSNKSHERILAATILINTNQIEAGNKLAIKTIYTNIDKIDDHLSRNFLSLINEQLGSVHDSSVKATFDTPNIVIRLKNNNEIISLAIIEENMLKVNDDQYFFDAYHLNSNSNKAIRIAAKYKISKIINYNSLDYEVEEIITLKTHLYRYFLDFVIKNSPNSKIELISTESPEDLIKQIQQKLSDSQKNGQLLLDNYNFKENIVGLPISGLSQNKSDLSDYETVFSYLLFNRDQYLFVPKPNDLISDKYVLSLSSLLLLNKLNLFSKLENIIDKISIPKYIFDRINNTISKITIEKDGAKGTLNLHQDKIYSQMRSLSDIEIELAGWISILEFIEKISLEECELTSDPLLNTLNYLLINEDKFSIDLAHKNESCLIIDDFFISRALTLTKYNNFNINSTYGLIYSEKLLNIEQTLDLLDDLVSKKYYAAVTANLLYELVMNIVSTQENIDKYYSKFYTLLRTKICLDSYYSEIIKEFIELLYRNNRFTELNHLFIR
ncbi:hypothetical protein FQ087_02910 [Sporosarcina sp. ANT_H38]|uniref:hypothetical protein n=1 Tax=Sporosarcina sp. ANT_H38 TaxID=2597358 RepID=UPI0011F20497|nr:hypothetical protein [Sporosarcina sp. ANT_H38]KAA0965275.1 hypothetical protein FQ087_02910 [Sporosarcina sp. ANT_H38]